MKTVVQQLLELIPDAYEIKDYIFENDADTKMLDRWLWEKMFKGKDWVELEKQQIIDAYGKGSITATSLMDKKARGEYLNAEQYYNQTYPNETTH